MLTAAPPPYADWNWHAWPAGREMAWHRHDFLQAIHVVAGELLVDWGGGWTAAGPGDVHVLPPGVAHRLSTAQGHRQFGLNWRPRGDERGLLAAFLALDLRPGLWHAPDLLDRLAPLQGLGERPDSSLGPRLGQVLDGYALGLLDLLEGQRQDPWRRVLAHLEARLTAPIAVEAVAAALSMSRAQLQRLCHARSGCGLARHHARLRIAAAARWLATQDGSVAACAEAFGFPDQAQFSRAFKRCTGQTPSAFRAGHRPVL